ncbi:MAG TPA: carboxypeptidase M32 [Phycisphaerae bacterium]|nr:carboxypeptidase M32 [Phycisphaerae bacterium]
MPVPSTALENLLTRLADIHNLDQSTALLEWDQLVMMPPKGAEARAKQLSTLAKLSHELHVARETQDLLAAAEAEKPGDEDHKAMLRVARRNLDKAIKVPTSLVVALKETTALAHEVWAKARTDNNYPAFAPWLEKLLHLKRQYAAAIDPRKPIYDVLHDDYEEGMTTATLDPLFATLKNETIPFVAAIQEHADRVSEEPLTRDYDPALQQKFAIDILRACGLPFDRARLDTSVHPFCTNFSPNDVRITTRYEKNWLPGALFGVMHEMGHAFYELNINPAYEHTPLSGGVSLGVHESQSRLWENLVGRSRGFWNRFYPHLQQTFHAQLAATPLDTFYKSINRVKPSFIRVEADEVTYNLHIILRYEMEQELLTQKLSVQDAPQRWNEKMRQSLGITPPTDREGILQDVHWSGGGIGYFPTYSLGNILAAQLFQSAKKDLPSLMPDIQSANFAPLYSWLKTHVHHHGRKYPPAQLIPLATGQPLTTEPYLHYLKTKFSEIYEL